MIRARIIGMVLVAVTAGWAAGRIYSLHRAAVAATAPATAPAMVSAGVPSAGRAAQAGPTALPELEASQDQAYLAPAAKIPDRLPAFTLDNEDGKPTPISGWDGKSLVLNFWATWCAPCRREIPLLQALNQEWQNRDFAVIGIAVDHRDQVREFATQLGIHYPLLVGEQAALDVAGSLGIDSPVFPFTVFTDRRGRVVTVFVGELHRPEADLILAVVERLNRDQVELMAAQRAIADGLGGLKPRSTG
jgi:peroxiredoxin